MGGISETAVNKDDLIALSCVCYVCTYGSHDCGGMLVRRRHLFLWLS
ncbi:unnamed protein product [Chondrus crispus]|uniref:Uncharacterized protein n=1 Tax=Chondrus crispus TaxID=2769 RepID=R7QMH3_CHOCR|nr:unnamed protein product [Chondrus crispus]CDF39299.1 unnamed protein product [Chondrus crispus]|eukprot:XP_005719210.1 unnamed protein product [Chondrus crispus]